MSQQDDNPLAVTLIMISMANCNLKMTFLPLVETLRVKIYQGTLWEKGRQTLALILILNFPWFTEFLHAEFAMHT